MWLLRELTVIFRFSLRKKGSAATHLQIQPWNGLQVSILHDSRISGNPFLNYLSKSFTVFEGSHDDTWWCYVQVFMIAWRIHFLLKTFLRRRIERFTYLAICFLKYLSFNFKPRSDRRFARLRQCKFTKNKPEMSHSSLIHHKTCCNHMICPKKFRTTDLSNLGGKHANSMP